jgi:pimeloyl-ACP methyl ester carboxylesterase
MVSRYFTGRRVRRTGPPFYSCTAFPLLPECLSPCSRCWRRTITSSLRTIRGSATATPLGPLSSGIDHIAEIVDSFTDVIGLKQYTLYMQDYGGPVGFRLALAHPDKVQAMIIQNAVAHIEGLSPLWDTRQAYWKDRAKYEDQLRTNFTSFEATKQRHLGTSPHPERIDPDTWTDEYAFLTRPGETAIQLDLFYDYQNNVAAYPRWQQWLRDHQPQLLVVWGKYDPSFTVAGAFAYKRDVPNARVVLLDAGHFALDEAAPEIAMLILAFLDNQTSAAPQSLPNNTFGSIRP